MYHLEKINITDNMETVSILKKVNIANKKLAELKGIVKTIPNEKILINFIFLQEAKDSSAIENIITTHDELYKQFIFDKSQHIAAKEVENYVEALYSGYDIIKNTELLTINGICEIQSILERNNAGIRSQSGTKILNAATGKVIYEPPQTKQEIEILFADLENFINNDALYPELDNLIKMAIIHYQFEKIHPFFDGNGRTGRIINVLYLTLKKLLDSPVLYLSKYIIENKQEYYSKIDYVTKTNDYEPYILFMLDAVYETSCHTISIVEKISKTMMEVKHKIRDELKLNYYSQELINALFYMPYTKIAFIEEYLNITRRTSAKYLNELCEYNILSKHKLGNNVYYINETLANILSNT